jgi:surface antigen
MKLTSIFHLLTITGAASAIPVDPEKALASETHDTSSIDLLPRAGDDYPYKSSCNTAHDIDPWNFYKCECTSFVAWRLNAINEIDFTNHYKSQHWGDASHWDDAVRAAEVKMDKTPKKRAVAQTDEGAGHVAWMKSVSKDGKKVTVEEYNWRRDRYGVRTVDKGEFEWYIHL